MSDMTQCWLQITSGRGPIECQFAVTKLAKKIIAEAQKKNVTAEIIEQQQGDKKETALSVLISVSGQDTFSFVQTWIGSILWICKSPFRPNHKRKNWFVGVDLLQPPNANNSHINERDVSFEAIRATGPGGQHVNTTNSAVRATHKPSGLTVLAREERSQHMNKKLALARLAEKLLNQQQKAEASAKQSQWTQHNNLTRGEAIRVFEGINFQEK